MSEVLEVAGNVATTCGVSLNASDLKKGLVELNQDISFDAATNRPSDYSFVMSGADNMTTQRGGVFYQGRFIVAMDRGVITENPVNEMVKGYEEIRMCDIERYDETRVVYLQIMPSDPGFHHALLKAQNKDDNYQLDGDGKVFRYKAVREAMVPGKFLRVGWRHTLSFLVKAGIPGVTPQAITEKFGVRL